MGQATANIAKELMEAWESGKTIQCFLLSGNTTSWQTDATLEAMDFMDDITDDEPSWTGYSRVTLTNIAITANAAEGRAEFDCDDVDFGATMDSSSATLDGVGFCVDVTDDTDSPIVGVVNVTGEATADRTPAATGFTVAIGANGLIHLTTSAQA